MLSFLIQIFDNIKPVTLTYYIFLQSEKLQEKKEATVSKEPATKEEAVTTVVPTATDDLNHAYKRRQTRMREPLSPSVARVKFNL